MNFTSLSGFALAACILFFGVIHPAPKPALFLDVHALLLVVGGTLSAGLIAFPVHRFVGLGKMFVYGFLLKRSQSNRKIVTELVLTSAATRTDARKLAARKASHPFLREGYQLIAEGIIPEAQLREILNHRSQYFKRMYAEDARMLTALAKFPPAFGLLGASTGMISMMINLGKGGQDTIGPAMAVALVATFWGIAIANFLLLPLADYAAKVSADDSNTRQIIVDGLIMLKQGRSPILVAEGLNSHLPISSRVRVNILRDKIGVVLDELCEPGDEKDENKAA